MGATFPLTRRLWQQNTTGDPNFHHDDAVVMMDGHSLVGCVVTRQARDPRLSSRYPGIGWISVVVVDPAYQRRGIGHALMDWAEERLRQAGLQRVVAGGDVAHFFPGLPQQLPAALAFFAARGYKINPTVEYDLIGNVHLHHPRPESLAALSAAKAEVVPARSQDVPALLDFLAAEFPGRWAVDAEHRLLHQGVAPHDVLLLRREDTILGFAWTYDATSVVLGPSIYWYRLLGRRYGGMGPLGIAAAERGKGLGLALVDMALANLSQRGVHRAVIDWTTLVDFYARVGFRPWKAYLRADRPL